MPQPPKFPSPISNLTGDTKFMLAILKKIVGSIQLLMWPLILTFELLLVICNFAALCYQKTTFLWQVCQKTRHHLVSPISLLLCVFIEVMFLLSVLNYCNIWYSYFSVMVYFCTIKNFTIKFHVLKFLWYLDLAWFCCRKCADFVILVQLCTDF